MNTTDTLLAYSEWLDGEKLMTKPAEGDERTHQQIIEEFMTHWHENDDTPCVRRSPLAGEVALPNTMGKWLYLRMRKHMGRVYAVVEWEDLTSEDQAYWEHEARATERAVHRGGFKHETKEEYSNGQ